MDLVDLPSLLADPIGRCTGGSTWLYFYPRATLAGFAAWSTPTEDDARQLIRVLQVELGRSPHVSLVDVSQVTGGDPVCFDLLRKYVAEHRAELTACVERLAIVRPPGALGALATGFFGVTPQPYPVEVFDTRAAALSWLGVEDAATFSQELERHAGGGAGTSAVLRQLRLLLERAPNGATPASAARALGLSTRTLQRRLGEENTSFTNELGAARVRAAQASLLYRDAKIAEIAHDVGCSSESQLGQLFARFAGVSPAAWRRRARGDA
jgi:AraC-like DNA-binding protein